jgi:SAM-dependent methyltransferase
VRRSGLRSRSSRLINPVAASGFASAADAYERSRPSYAIEAVADLGLSGRIVDLAAGTGKLTRLLLPYGEVVAVEPVAEMRAHAVRVAPAIGATAETLPFRDESVDVVTVGQAFHWFDAPRALAEIARVVRPGGLLALLWNERDNRVPWVEAVTSAIHACDPGTAYEKDIDWPAVVAASQRFTPVEVRTYAHDHPMDVELVVDRAMSTSYVAAGSDAQRVDLAARIREILAGFEGTFAFPHVTTVYACARS